ncbi:ABC transporter permease [Sedimenticola selenatireducens]|uniref:FtsX-like permease family protein n=1 Tax=Sedimenticola selenatireducens TaxID=191960 RepID=A0A557SMT4_9GAMM|nr:FtsX-like permease family protein [Sedimenticola selenatireducens]TVO78737.1 FtsX-like permease family protein [Sedimenticola selenatireducens]TVT62099.1 MAG: FtsX-like permease family protein [Sedimenticola selenatireducens]
MSWLSLALRFFRRDWRSGEMRLLVLALIVAVAAVSAVGFFTDRVEQAMIRQANQVLAADLVLSSNNPIPESFEKQANQLELQIAHTLTFPSVIVHQDETQLVEVKAVSKNYPLRGDLRIRTESTASEQVVTLPPTPGNLWGEARLMAALNLQPGADVSLGEARFSLQNILSRDSALGNSFFRLGPEVMIALEDIPKTGLVTPASRVRYRLLIAGDQTQVATYKRWASNELPTGVRLEHLSSARPELRNALDRGSRFLGLAALVAVLVAGATVALSTRQFVERQSDTSAIMRCLGASQSMIFSVLIFRLCLLGLIASLLGIAGGWLAQHFLAGLLSDWFGGELPPTSLRPVLIGLGTGMITLIGFTLPPAIRLGAVPPLRVLRRDLGAPPVSTWLLIFFSIGAMALLMFWQAGDFILALWVLLGTVTTVCLLLMTAWLLVRVLTPLRHRGGALWRQGLAGLARAPAMTALQLTGFGLGILAMLLLSIIRLDLLSAWQHTIPDQAPNHFLINIQPDDVNSLNSFFQENNIQQAGIYPMLRARLTHINSQPVSPDQYQDDRAQRLVAREFNLSWATQIQEDNQIVSGSWWEERNQDKPLFSVEVDLANTLGIKIGDQLAFDLAGVPIEARVSNLRRVHWDSFQPNFFVVGTPTLLKSHPTNYITSFYLPPGKEASLAALVRQFPSITIIDVSAIMQQIREIMQRGSLAVEYVFLFTLAAGLLMLYAGIQASRDYRRQEAIVLRTLGLQRKGLLTAAAIEFVTLGLLAGTLATLCANVTGWFIATEVFGFQFNMNAWTLLIGIIGSGAAIGVAGIIATWPLSIKPPLRMLQNG